MVRSLAVVAAVVALTVAAGDADARKHRRTPAHAKKHKAPRHRRPNMPDGWAWPPTREMRAAGKACTDELDRRHVAWKPAKAERKITTPITVPAMEFGGVKLVPTFRKPPFVMDCQLARALVIHGEALYARGVRELHFSRIYGYTQVRTRGRTLSALSRHALGLAVDIRAVVDDAGHKGVVLDDYLAGDALLASVENYLNDSGGFRMVLTPRNDPKSHYDHFHVEARADYRAPPPSGKPRSRGRRWRWRWRRR